MTQLMLIDAQHPEETRVVITNDGQIEEFDFVTQSKTQIKSNIYLAKITRVEPSLQAAFVEYGNGKQGFLSFSEIHPDYYQIPLADRQRILEEERRAEEEAQARADAADDEEDAIDGDEDGEESSEARSTPQDDEDGNPRRGRRRSRRRGRRRGRDEREQRAQGEGDSEGETTDAENAEHTDSTNDTPEATVTVEAPEAAIETVESANETPAPADAEAETSSEAVAEEAPAKPKRGRRPTKKRPAEMSNEDDELTIASEIIDEDASDEELAQEAAEEAALAHSVVEVHAPEASSDEGDDEDEDERSEQDEVETISGEESDETHSAPHQSFRRRYKIQEVIKRGQIVLVQVIKEERGNKGVSLTTYISLPGRYCVLMPNSPKGGGISRKIARGEDRKRLRSIAAELKESRGLSAIIRTAGIDRTQTEIQRDYEYLVKLWNQIRETAISSTAPALVYEEGDIVKRSIRDYYNPDLSNIIIQGEDAYNNAREFMKLIMPSHGDHVKLHRGDTPIFSAYDVEAQLQAMHKPTARLRSGGYIVIDPTEALISIDVNSGRSTTERNVEETALKTNLEAAAQIARQLRLRDLGGLVVVDFIDMYFGKHRRMVERAFKDALKKDRAKIQVGHISAFGLLELSRQRLRPSIAETTSMPCTHCGGSGRIRSRESLAIEIIRELEKDASSGNFSELVITVSIDQAVHLLNHSRHYFSRIEQEHGVRISVKTDNNISGGSYTIDRVKGHGQNPRHQDRERERQQQRERDRERDRQRQQQRPARQTENTDEDTSQDDTATEGSTDESGQPQERNERGSRRRRGSRGGRRRRFNERDNANENASEDADALDEATNETNDTAEDASENTQAKTQTPEDAAPAPSSRRRGGHAVREPKAVTPAEDEVAPAPSLVNSEDKPAPVRTVPVIEEPEPAVIVVEQAPSEKKPSRGGWWRRIVE